MVDTRAEAAILEFARVEREARAMYPAASRTYGIPPAIQEIFDIADAIEGARAVERALTVGDWS